MNIIFNKNFIFITIIIILSFFLRFINLNTIPNGLSDDEAAFGYNAFSIIKTRHDEWGKYLPITTFKSFGDYKLPLYFYLTAVPVWVFGLNEFAVRFPTAIFGVFSVVATYFLVKKLFDEKTGLLAAFLLAISPFHIFVSRHALESAVPIFFIITGTIFFIKSFKDKRMIYLSLFFFAFSLYIYRSTWIFVPIYLAALVILFKHELAKNLKNTILAIAIFAILATPIIIISISTSGSSRLRQIGITSEFNMIGLVNDINYQRGICQERLPQMLCKSIYNKYFAVGTKYISNYVSHYSPQLLFISGSFNGEQMMSGRGFLYFIELPFIIIALLVLGKNYKKLESKILLPWLLIYPLASASAGFETPGRQAISMPIWQILAAVGFFIFYNYITKLKLTFLKSAIIAIFSLILIYQFGKFTIDYFIIYPQNSGKNFRYGYKKLFTYLKSQEQNYDKIVISNKIDQSHQYILQLFFQQVNPSDFLNPTYVDRYFDNKGWVVVTRIGKYNYVSSAPGLENLSLNTLIVVNYGEINTNVKPIYQINYPDGEKEFDIFKVDDL